jgi:hypothetical protein
VGSARHKRCSWPIGAAACAPQATAAQAATLAPRPPFNARVETVTTKPFFREPFRSLVVQSGARSLRHRDAIISLAARYKLPAVYSARDYASVGGLLSGLTEHRSVPGRMIPGATALAASSLETIHFGPEYCGRALLLRRAVNGGMEMDAQATTLQTAENDLKQLMADVARAMEKAQDAVTRIVPKAAAATTETESTSR